ADNPTHIYKKQGEKAEITCSHQIDNYDQILWYRRSKNNEMKLLGYMYVNANTEPGVTVQIGGEKYTWSDLDFFSVRLEFNVQCLFTVTTTEAYFGKGTKLTVLEPGRKPVQPKVQILNPSPNECRNQKDVRKRKKTLVCVASGFYPDHVSVHWQHNGNNVTNSTGVATDANAQMMEDKFYTLTSRLRVKYEDWDDEHTFTCIVTFFDGEDYVDIPAEIKDKTKPKKIT
uniref:Ig-like domain-containing protein n=1 Tax=Sphaeramia orbicularis TaxID=375764 RepID=A0A673A8V6_9TELE